MTNRRGSKNTFGPKANWSLLIGCSFVLAWCFIGQFAAHASNPRFTSTTPPGGQRGSELDLRFNGSRLEDAQEIVFYAPGLEVLKLASVKTNIITARVRIAKDCPIGEHLLRIRTASGLSDLRTFWVGPF